ncbi:hypothetical protein FQZ97_1087820 [compost metagenome]
MKRCHLHHTFELVFGHHVVHHVEEIVEHREVGEQRGVHQQRGVDLFGRRVHQQVEFTIQIVQKRIEVARLTDHDAHLVLHVHRARERAQVQADHGLLDPVAGGRKDLFFGHEQGHREKGVLSRMPP